ncbi:MAG: RDD family protein [Acidimicrobiia bacterium]
MTPHVEPDRDLGLQGHFAGFVTRVMAFIIDTFTVLTLFALAAAVLEYVVSALVGKQVRLSEVPIVADFLLAAWWFFYCAYPIVQAGRTFGMAVVGLRVVRAAGSDIDARHAVVRVLVFPLSFVPFGLGFLLILLRRDRRALHDLIASSAVVYAWDARAARLRFLAKR